MQQEIAVNKLTLNLADNFGENVRCVTSPSGLVFVLNPFKNDFDNEICLF